ncbi:electron transfer flavoprotein subunit beta [Terrihabitans soli]|uniref:Electron transfer flavoprotein subunit beta n=1 Tax=Terrihabitans soli TaxID=708113 RepID=A0A6S6QJ13_9HYPH|nr:electron transfer flavoprotein subunit beta/FixA family protein [Terrihabitans soli]BCJ91243.1 electron transfer flavoprotein subunit beta [Terrihabitans soli]
MKILVAVKRVIDPNVRVHVKADKSGVETANVKMTMNPFDEIAVEEAVRLREKGVASEVVLASIGPAQAVDTLRAGLAMGADRGILVEAAAPVEPLAVAKLLRALALEEKAELVLLGKQAIDDDANQTGQMLAALLGWPQGTFASSVEIAEGAVRVTREVDRGLQVIRLQLPAVITTDLRLNEPRYAPLADVMKAKKKPVSNTTPDKLGVNIDARHVVLSTEEPAARAAGRLVNSVDELVDCLRNEARVI